MTDLTSALEQAVGMPSGIEHRDVRSRVRRRRRRRFALRAALGMLVAAAITPVIGASMSDGTRREDADFGADPTATAPSTSTSAMLPATPDGIALSWRTGIFEFAACPSDGSCEPGVPGGVEGREGVEVHIELPDGTSATGVAPTDSHEGPVEAARIEASWSVASTGEELSPFRVAVLTGPTATRLEMTVRRW